MSPQQILFISVICFLLFLAISLLSFALREKQIKPMKPPRYMTDPMRFPGDILVDPELIAKRVKINHEAWIKDATEKLARELFVATAFTRTTERHGQLVNVLECTDTLSCLHAARKFYDELEFTNEMSKR